jgi:RNA polymerase sigma factor (sigma-70 family)
MNYEVFVNDPIAKIEALWHSDGISGTERRDKLLETSWEHLRKAAEDEVSRDLQSKVSESDLVQDTLVAAQQAFSQCAARTPAEFLRWLEAILRHQAANARRSLRGTQKRAMGREVSLEEIVGAAGWDRPVDDDPVEAALAAEDLARLKAAVECLPEDERKVLAGLHAGLTYAEIGQRMEKKQAREVRAIRDRAFASLRKLLGGADGHDFA